MGGQDSSYAKIVSSQQQNSSSQNIVSQPSPSTSSSTTTSPLALLKQEKIDQTQWNTAEWFGKSAYWQNDLVNWIILASEEKESSEQKNIDKGLEIIRKETDEIFKAGMVNSDSYNSCLDLITRCRDIRDSNFNYNKRIELLKIIFGYLQMKSEEAKLIINTIEQMSVEQRSVLRFMTHQKIQSRIAFLRTTLKTHKSSIDMEGYHSENDGLREKNSELEGQIQLLSQADQTKTSHESFIRELIENCNKMTLNDDKMKSEYETQIKQLKSEYETQIKQLQERESKMKPEYEAHVRQLQERNDKMKSAYEEHINQLQEEANELRKEAKSANDEASGYQAALGSATNVRWSDSTFNNPIQLTKDIEKFQHLLADFTKVKGKSVKIDEDAAKRLLTKYECKANLNSKEIKNYLAAALQRMILEAIFNIADNLYRSAENSETFSDGRLESYIVYYTQKLVKFTNLLAKNREGKDSITNVTPIKIRQQVYAALGSRGFAKSNHSYMKKLVNDLVNKMEKYREVVDEEKKKTLHSEAEKIIRTGMQLWFCLKAQEPVPKIHWFKSGAHIETHLMVGSWESENIKENEVDFAFFPLIIAQNDTQDSQVFNKAQVFIRPKQTGKFQKIKGYLF
ncbi:hypothetical protein GLOIN_2v1646262 [Rhizophagus irregularis DAOM 181602=DAOM 197198]|uniref:Uncharacterized protein n=1 Tax=Rhizophagus irregularis (strain DAOM 181602 / DAOM 197198 / MUCL 43194) TaxID=747089 RepID=A0A2P4PQ99_RHIID|nr:hypothetical protein GLOIN_2v1646262 [Rhizophagus irregularis DAOM 181602=DAOM 197198]POG67565.1 hypothetical protein GLOIN_2v1646262 [Rhizophagus irregularis DAOM 181602=DAOM 197198]|eukprot:XP_025174431.1 hypothetical protein GLOIN_2v1646262 [Rhizophagus irregularis DAOM 181602=DAOM 197198]